MSQPVPRNLLDLTSRGQTKKTAFLVGNPQVSRLILRDAKHGTAGNAAYGSKSVILEVSDLDIRGYPDLPAIILKQRIWGESIEFPVSFHAVGTGNRDLTVIPSVQAAIGAEPNASIPVRQNRSDSGTRQSLLHGKRGDGKVAKAVKAV
jgi:hypothetical protein